ncbi:HNH endonuclease [Streptomyces sp. NBC_01762]|uniref:HNH endonuclease n=1 Tax=unclassified Streptomyces TaxID=2593676 RepID=UPI002DDA3996|nr:MULTISPECIES: HNH endonuclease [unclassified Streptomyces]WSC44977.1 HNH endonuclease [Streptomyces sp. NBC_01762]WSD24637.1 HNH endonuclease [Streptomyces sp. NBC_01751]
MKRIPPPRRNGRDDFDRAVSRRNTANKKILKEVRNDVLAAYGQYSSLLADISGATPLPVREAESSALIGNYSLLDRGRPLEDLRSAVLAASEPNGYACPLCGRTQVSAIDHFLPKSEFPEFSIFAENLVAVCDRCNRRKGDHCDRDSGLLFFHVYFEDLPEREILFAEIEVSSSVSVSYALRAPSHIDQVPYERLRRQFEILELADFYQKEAVSEISDHSEVWHCAFEEGGADRVRLMADILAMSAQKRGVNNWKSALYRGLSRSEEFCQRGFSLIGRVVLGQGAGESSIVEV